MLLLDGVSFRRPRGTFPVTTPTMVRGGFPVAGNEHDVNRSARSGKFVKDSTVERDPRGTTTEHVGGDKSHGDHEVNRSTSTGKFVTPTTAELHPSTTETQHVSN